MAQKIQSVLIHGKALIFYPIPPYVQKGMNLTVSTILDALQYVDPRTEAVRFQFDGELTVNELSNISFIMKDKLFRLQL